MGGDNQDYEDKLARTKKILADRGKKKDDGRQVAKAFALVGQLGLQMACCIVISSLIGIALDRWLGTAPWFIIIFAVLGVGASFKIIIDVSKEWKD